MLVRVRERCGAAAARSPLQNIQGFVQMQRPGEAVRAGAVVIVEPVGEVGVLLDFAQDEPGSDGVHRPGRHEKSFARSRVHPVQHPLNGAADHSFPQGFYIRLPAAGQVFPKSYGQARTRIRLQNVPHFRLARAPLPFPGILVGRMDLHAQLVGGKNEFHQHRE